MPLEQELLKRALQKASSISAGPGDTLQTQLDTPSNWLRGEIPTAPGKGGIFPGSGGDVAPIIDALKDIWRANQYPTNRGNITIATRAIRNPVARNVIKGMQQQGPAKYLTELAEYLRQPGALTHSVQEGDQLKAHMIDSLFPVLFGK